MRLRLVSLVSLFAIACANTPAPVPAAAPSAPAASARSACEEIDEHLENAIDAELEDGRFDAALARATRALDTCVRDPRAETTDRERVRTRRAATLLSAGKIDEGEAEAKRAYETLTSAVGEEHVDTAFALRERISALVHRRDYPGAKALELRLIAIYEKIGRTQDHARTLSKHAVLLARLFERTEALAFAKRGVEAARAAFPEESKEVAQAIGAVGEVHRMAHELDAAEPHLVQALAMLERLLGKNDTYVASAANNLAAFYHYGRHDLAKAEPLYRRALEQRRTFHPSNNTNTGQVLLNLGALLCEKGEWDEGRSLFEEGATIMERNGGKNNPELARSRAWLKRIEEQKARP